MSNRERVRIWDDLEKRFLWDDLVLAQDGSLLVVSNSKNNEILLLKQVSEERRKHLTVEHWRGRDRNNKDIFEGDKIKFRELGIHNVYSDFSHYLGKSELVGNIHEKEKGK